MELRTGARFIVTGRLLFDGMGKTENNTKQVKIPTPEALVQGVIGLVSLPEVCIRINEMLDDPRYSAASIGEVISQDAALTARLLRIVNSSVYNIPAKVETVSRAVSIVGHKELKELVVAATVSSIFEKISTDLIDIDLFWRHGIYTGILARIIANRCRVLHAERLFIAGLLHDIGNLVLCYKLPECVRASNALAQERCIARYEAENRVLGYNHADVGAQLMQQWGFPESHQVTAGKHHKPLSAKVFALESMTIYLADRMAHLAELGDFDRSKLSDVPDPIWKMTHMSLSEIEPVLISAREQFIEALQLFRPGHSSDTDVA